MIRRLVLVVSVICVWTLLAAAAMAQENRKWEVFGGFSYFRVETAPELDVFGVAHINTLGWHASFSEYPLDWLGGTCDFSGFYGRPTITVPANYIAPGNPPTNLNLDNSVNSSTYTAMFGPSFASRRNPNVKAFTHILLGVVREDVSLTSKGEILAGTSVRGSDTTFGFAVGGGVDFKITNLVAVRGQADWIRSTFKDGGDDRQNHVRVSMGLVFRLGS